MLCVFDIIDFAIVNLRNYLNYRDCFININSIIVHKILVGVAYIPICVIVL